MFRLDLSSEAELIWVAARTAPPPGSSLRLGIALSTGIVEPFRAGGAGRQAAIYNALFSSFSIASRIRNFCILPVTVIGKSDTKRTWRGIL
jgi:hypothetical protein